MNLESFNEFCATLPATTHVVQWHNSQVWNVGGKVFAIGSLNKNNDPVFTFKTSEQNFYYLRECDGYIPAPYFASRGMKWIQQVDSRSERDEDLKYYLTESHRQVSVKLTKALQRELGLLS